MASKYSLYPERKKERMREAHRKWAAKNSRKEYYDKYEKTRDPKTSWIKNVKARAKANNIRFELEIGQIDIPSNCPICNREIRFAKGVRGGTSHSPTIDRIIPDKGYVLENIAVICKKCNSQKSDSTSEELRRLADWIDEKLKKV